MIEALPEPSVRDEPLPPMWVPSDRGRDRPIFDDREHEPERGPPDARAASELEDTVPLF